MAVASDKKLPQEAQNQIEAITANAQKTGDWASANAAANAVRNQYGADYTVSQSGATSQTGGSSQYKSGSGYDAGTDYGTQLQNLVGSGASASDVWAAMQSRYSKIANNPNLAQYANDSIMQSAIDYLKNYNPVPTPNSKWESQRDNAVSNYAGYDMTDLLNSDEYASRRSDYQKNAQAAMQNVLGQVSARTGGMASSYATTAANQTYNDYMSQLEEVAQEMYNEKKSDLYNQANLYQSLYDDNYQQYQDSLAQYNTNRNYNYQTGRDAVSDALTKQEYADSRSDYADTRSDTAKEQLVNAIGSTGYTPTAAELAAAGMTSAEAAAWKAAYESTKAASAAKSSSSSSKKSTSTTMDYDGLFAAAQSSGNAKSWLAQKSNYQKYGFSSSSGLYDDYQAWAKEQTGGGMNTNNFTASAQSIASQLAAGRYDAAESNVNRIWDSLTYTQKQSIQSLLSKFGLLAE